MLLCPDSSAGTLEAVAYHHELQRELRIVDQGLDLGFGLDLRHEAVDHTTDAHVSQGGNGHLVGKVVADVVAAAVVGVYLIATVHTARGCAAEGEFGIGIGIDIHGIA